MRRTLLLALVPAVLATPGGRAQPVAAPPLKHMTVNGTDLAYVEQGSGDPVVLVHGEVSDYRTWEGEMATLAKRYRVIAYSRRYHFPNTGGGDGTDYSYALHAADLTAFVQALGAGPVNLVGHSYGGGVAFLVARDHPELVNSLVLAEGPSQASLLAGRPEEKETAEAEERTKDAVRTVLAGGNVPFAVRQLQLPAYGAEGFGRLTPKVLSMFEENDRALLSQMASLQPPTPFDCADARRIALPVLLVDGELSPPTKRLTNDVLQGCLPSVQRVQIPGSSHGLPFEKPAEFGAAVLAFLDRLRGLAPEAPGPTPTPTPVPRVVRTVEVNGAELTYVMEGSGEPLVFVHDELGDYRGWEEKLPVFAPRFRVVAYSRRNHYPSPWRAGSPNTLAWHVRDLFALVQTLGLGPVHLVGHSDGAAVAALFARDHPEVVRSLTLAEPFLPRVPRGGTQEGRDAAFQTAALNTAVKTSLRQGGESGAAETMVNWMSGTEDSFTRLPPVVREQLVSNARTLQLDSGGAPDFSCIDAQGLTAPVLVIRGEKSPRLFQLIADALEACQPRAQRVTIAGASHRVPFETPKEFDAAVLKFLSGLPKPAPAPAPPN